MPHVFPGRRDAQVKTTELPTAEQVAIIRQLDPEQIYTGSGLSTLTFERYASMLRAFSERLA